jgi:hypothetical protein
VVALKELKIIDIPISIDVGLISVLCTLDVYALRLFAPGPPDGFATENSRGFLFKGLQLKFRIVKQRQDKLQKQ